MLPSTGRGSWLGERMNFKTGFRVSPIYPNSIFEYNIDKLADRWSSLKPKSDHISSQNQSTETNLEAEADDSEDSTV